MERRLTSPAPLVPGVIDVRISAFGAYSSIHTLPIPEYNVIKKNIARNVSLLILCLNMQKIESLAIFESIEDCRRDSEYKCVKSEFCKVLKHLILHLFCVRVSHFITILFYISTMCTHI